MGRCCERKARYCARHVRVLRQRGVIADAGCHFAAGYIARTSSLAVAQTMSNLPFRWAVDEPMQGSCGRRGDTPIVT
jgi:hypothetical protein